jgi:hypothetical protein
MNERDETIARLKKEQKLFVETWLDRLLKPFRKKARISPDLDSTVNRNNPE